MILVVGATGDLGGRVARLLRSEGQDVRCLVRQSSDVTGLSELGAEVVRGDLTVPASLSAACRDVDIVLATATAIGRRLAGSSPATIRAVDEQGMSSLVDASEAAGVRRFVYMSFAGADAAIGTPLERAKLAIERRLASSVMRTVIVRSDAFQEVNLAPTARFDMAAGKATVIGKGDTKRRWVATEDVATLLSAVALEPDPPVLIEFGGPEPLTKNEAIAIAAELTHHRMKVQHMPRLFARLAIRLLNRRNDALASVFGAGLLTDLHEATWDDKPLRQRGISPKLVSDFLREQARNANQLKDAVGNVLADGDTVTIAKDLKVKGAGGGVVKVGTKVRGIRLIEDGVGDHDIDATVPGFGRMQLKSSVVKKVL